jgi:hypothetical protein
VDKGGVAASKFAPGGTFATVTRLSSVPSPEVPFARAALEKDIFVTEPPWPAANSIVAGWLELTGGEGRSGVYSCRARFDVTGNPYVRFPSNVVVTYTKTNGAILQVLKFASGGTSWDDIALPGPDITVGILNDVESGTSGVSHFDMYSRISTKRTASGGYIDLPNVRTDGTICIAGSNAVPGCSNSAWP